MKNAILICLLVFTASFLACDESNDDDSPAVDDMEALEMAMAEIDWNALLLNDILDEAATKMSQEVIDDNLGKAQNRAEFLRLMSGEVEGLFEQMIQQNNDYINTGGVNFINGWISEDRAAYWDRILDTEDPIQAYFDLLEPVIDQADEDHKDWINLISFVDESENAYDLPEDEQTLTRRTARIIINMKDLISEAGESGAEPSEIEELFVTNGVPETLAALILPAVQKVREAASKEPFNAWIDDNIEDGVEGNLDRDIIRRLQIVSLLSTMDLIMNEEFVRTNQDGYSVSLMQAQYEAYWMFLWSEFWEE